MPTNTSAIQGPGETYRLIEGALPDRNGGVVPGRRCDHSDDLRCGAQWGDGDVGPVGVHRAVGCIHSIR